MQVSVKFLPLYGAIALLCTLAYAAYHGRAYGRSRVNDGPGDKLMLDHHKDGVLWSALALGLTVVLIEAVLYELKPPRSWLFAYHMPAALGMTGVFVLMASWLTGLRFPALHRRLFRAFLACLTGAASTGGVMLAQM